MLLTSAKLVSAGETADGNGFRVLESSFELLKFETKHGRRDLVLVRERIAQIDL